MKKVLKKRYEVLGTLGRGGMGCVYKVADRTRNGEILAAKELRVGNLSTAKLTEAVAQFRTEAGILMRLTHRNLPKVSDYFSARGAYYIVMEYIEGATLEQILVSRKGKPLDERLALGWALQICRAMHFLSVQRPRPIVFRDLKPSNIMVDRKGRVTLIDFGIARFFKADQLEDTYVYGTPGYAAPEQYGTGQTDGRSDIFSLGATLHHALTGRSPSISPLDFPDPRELNPSLRRDTAAIIKKALEPDMGRRYQSAKEMKKAVQEVLLDMSSTAMGKNKIIEAKPGRVITIPWWRKTSWVSVPVMALGLSGTTGTLSAKENWIRPKPRNYSPNAARLLFRVESESLKWGREYRPHIIVKTDAGVLRPRLLFKKPWPWIILEALLIAMVIAAYVIARWG